MLLRMFVVVFVAALALVLAACAETGGAVASALAAQAAEQAAAIAATQAEMATTQAIDQLEAAATQTSAQLQATGKILPSTVNKGTFVIDTPQAIIFQKDGKRYIMMKPQYEWDPNWQQDQN